MNIDKLKGKIREKGMTYKMLSKRTGIGLTSINHKVNGKKSFKQEEMSKVRKVLNLSDRETIEIFFWEHWRKELK